MNEWFMNGALAAGIGYAGWLGLSIVSLRQKAAKVGAEVQVMQDWLKRIEEKLDRALGQ